MNNNVIRMFLAVGAACICGSALHAQSNDLSAKVPFTFQVSGKAFPAGRYVVGEYGYTGVMSLKSGTTGSKIFITGADHALTRVGPPRLVFHCYAGDTCFLAEVRPASGPGSKVAMSKAEKEIANGEGPREMATVSVDLRHAD
jgi:hypothetical protein